MNTKTEQIIWGFLRISLGWIFLWAFLDKLFGLGFATKAESAWLSGGSPTLGFLKFATKGPFAEVFQSMAGSILVDWLFMLGLLLIGLALMLGIMVKLASLSGMVMLILMYLAALLPEHNPFVDDHIIYSLVLLLFLFIPVGDWLGFGRKWSRTSFVRNMSWLR